MTLKEDQSCYLLLLYLCIRNLDRAQWGWLVTVPSCLESHLGKTKWPEVVSTTIWRFLFLLSRGEGLGWINDVGSARAVCQNDYTCPLFICLGLLHIMGALRLLKFLHCSFPWALCQMSWKLCDLLYSSFRNHMPSVPLYTTSWKGHRLTQVLRKGTENPSFNGKNFKEFTSMPCVFSRQVLSYSLWFQGLPRFPILNYLPEFALSHVHWVSYAI